MEGMQILITVTPDGQLQVAGAIENKMVAYGMLELAKEAINNMHVEKARRIQTATAAERLQILGGGKDK